MLEKATKNSKKIKRRRGNTLENWEIALVKAMIQRGGALTNDQDILAAAEAMLDDRSEIFLDNGRLAAAGGSDILQRLIASCSRTTPALGGPGGEIKILRELSHLPLHVMVTPLRSKAGLTDIPWIGIGTPVAIVTVRDLDLDRRRRQVNLRRRFGLTIAESRLATEILKGDGRAAAARRRGISNATARSHLASIFEKTGTHRQAELIRLLLDTTDEDKIET